MGGAALLLIGVGWCAFLGLLDWDLAGKVWRQAQSAQFQEGRATILQSEVSRKPGSKGRPSYGVEVQYRYEVDGLAYTNDCYAFQATRSTDSEWAHAAVRCLPKGRDVPFFYDPAQPERAVLRQGIDGSDLFILMFLTPFHVIGAGLLSGGVYSLCHRGQASRRIRRSSYRGQERINAGTGGPWTSFLVVLGLATFFAIFVVAFGSGFHPPLAVPGSLWGGAFLWAAWAALSAWRKNRAGYYDIVLDQHALMISLPPMHGRKRREEFQFTEVAGVEARERITGTPGRRQRQQRVLEVMLRMKDGRELLALKPWTLAEGEEWAELLRNRIGHLQAKSPALAEK